MTTEIKRVARPDLGPESRPLNTGRPRLRAPWAALAWIGLFVALSGYTYLRSAGDEVFAARQVGGIEQAIFRGVPSEVLQDQIYDRDVLWFDFIGYCVHVSWFMVPYFAGFALLMKARHRLLEYFAWVLATHFLGAIMYLLLPVEPPWMELGTTRVLDERVFIPFTRADNNPVAAFPSLHAALPVTIALFFVLRMHSPRWAMAFAGWALAIGFFVVYMGEHWVIDVAGGYALGGLVAFLFTNPAIARLAHRIPGDPVGLMQRFNRYAFPAPRTHENPAELRPPAREAA